MNPSMESAALMFSSTRENTNYARLCRLLVDVGSQVLREVFDKIRPVGGLDTVLGSTSVSATLQSLRHKNILNPLQWRNLYPAIKSSVSSKNFDITLLMVLLRSICGLTPPATGWNDLPPPTDLTCGADIVRINYYRKTMYAHVTQASFADEAFDNHWSHIRDTLVRLGGPTYEAAIDDLKYEYLNPDMEERYKELLKQWKMVEDNIKDKLNGVEAKVDELQASVNKLERQLRPTFGKWNEIKTRTLLVESSLACLEVNFIVSWCCYATFSSGKQNQYICHNVNIQNLKFARRDSPHILASDRCEGFENLLHIHFVILPQ